MKIINTAFGVLNDPEKRVVHDAWIAQQEAHAPSAPSQPSEPNTSWKQEPARDYMQEALSRAWQEIYSRYPILNSHNDSADEMAIASQWTRMRLLVNAGKDEEHALRTSADHVAKRFEELRDAELKNNIRRWVWEKWRESDSKTFEEIAKEMYRKHPILLQDDIALDATTGLHHEYVAKGISENSAWRTAYENVGNRFSILTRQDGYVMPEDRQVISQAQAPHPWRRFFARYVDMFLLMFIGYFVVGFSTSLIDKYFLNPVGMEVKINLLGQAAIAMVIAVLLETIAISLHGRTLGKWLFNMKVEGYKGSPTIKESFVRTLDMTACGIGFYIQFLYLVLSVPCYYHLIKKKTTWWDSAAGTRVVYGELTNARKVLCVMVVIASMAADTAAHNWDKVVGNVNYRVGASTFSAAASAYAPPSTPHLQQATNRASSAGSLLLDHAQRWFRVYPFLDDKSPLANRAAIDAVIARKNELIGAGYEPVVAMDQACGEIAPRYAIQTVR